jgi:DNA polymerase-3 subunit alpha
VHLHTHSEYSPLDGLSKIPEIVEQVAKHGQEAVAITDHGVCAGHPQLQKECQKAGLKPIFGIEAYFQNDRFARSSPENTKERNREIRYGYHHLVMMATNETGLHNLWAMSTESFRDGFYDKKPRMDWDTVRKYSEGVIASSACLRGPIARPILDDDEDLARQNLVKLLDIFGDRFYLEIQPNQMADQEKVNWGLVRLAKEYGVPLLATVDSHYPTKDDHEAHQTWIAIQQNQDVNDESDLFAVNLDLYVQSEEEARKGLAYLGQSVVDESIANTVEVAKLCNAVIGGKSDPPVYSKKGGAEKDAERLLEVCVNNWGKAAGKEADQDAYMERFEREFNLLRQKRFCGYFLMVADYCRFAKENGILVGPGRGSGAGSLGAYLCDITEVDPLEADLPFERFMTEGRTSLPDFDVDFPASKKDVMLQYLRDKYGYEYVISIGTHLKLKSKGIIKDLGRALKSVMLEGVPEDQHNERYGEILRDLNAVSKIIDAAEAGTAGLGIKWDDLWVQHGDELQPYRVKYPYLFAMADKLVGRPKTYGKHAAGVVISTDRKLTNWLPLSCGENADQMVSQFDMVSLEELGLVKFDILTIRTLDTVQMAVDLIRERRSVEVDIYHWKDEYRDPIVWDMLVRAETLGMFQIETKSGTRLCQQMGPTTMPELSDMITIVRPGPMRSGLTELYLKRRAGMEPVSFPDPRMEAVLGPTFGCMIYQEQIMQACILLAGYTSDEADNVRKILGKKKVEQIGPAGQEFVSRAVEWGGMDRDAASHLWDQMAEFAKYSFNKAHAYSYATITYWTAWLKTHYPIEFFVACLSTIDQNRIPEFIKEVRRNGYTVLPPDINASRKGFQAEPLAVRYGLDAIKGVGETAVDYLVAGQYYANYQQFEEYVTQKGTKANAAIVALLAKVGALDSLEPRRAGLVARLEAAKEGVDARCIHKDDRVVFEVEGMFMRFRKSPQEDDVDAVFLRPQGPDESDEAYKAYYEQYQEEYKQKRGLLPPDFCTFDWSTEPAPVNPRTNKLLARKALPKKCTKACRQYTPPPPLDLDAVPAWSDEKIRTVEHELLGVFLSSSPFDQINPDERETLLVGAEAVRDNVVGQHALAAIVMGVRKVKTRVEQKDMAFLTLDTELDTVEVVVYSKEWAEYQDQIKLGQLCLIVVEKKNDDRDPNLRAFQPF